MMPEMIHAKAIVIDDEFELTGSANLDERHPHAGGSGAANLKSTPTLYNPSDPERTLLYQTIAEHFETKHELAGLSSSRRGHITVPDRAGLERHACECCDVVKSEMTRLLCY